MQAVFFPFTWMPPALGAALTAWFPSLVVYLPGGAGCGADPAAQFPGGRVELRRPPGIDDGLLDALVAEHLDWAARQPRDARVRQGLRPSAPPFVDATQVNRIRGDLRRRIQGDPSRTDAQRPDPLLDACLFLRLAHAHDLGAVEAQRHLARVDRMQARMQTGIGSDAPVDPSPPAASDPGTVHPGARLTAWARLWCARPGPERIFVTSSPEVLDRLLERVPDLAATGRDVRMGLDPAGARSRLEALVHPGADLGVAAAADPADAGGARVAVWRVAEPPERVWSQVAGDSSPGISAAGPAEVLQATHVVLATAEE